MNLPQILQSLLLVASIVDITWSLKYDQSSAEFLRRNRRIALSEYLVPPPPPPPRNHPPTRTGRYVSPQIPQGPPPQGTESQGYLAKIMGWLNPFGGTSSSYSPLPPPPPPPPLPKSPQIPAPLYPPYPLYPPLSDPNLGGPAPSYNGPPQPPFARHPPPHPGHHGHNNNYGDANRRKTCNPCNKVPWVPMQNTDYYMKGPIYNAPQQQWPHNKQFGSYDNHHASSQEIRTPDFSHLGFRQSVQGGPLPNPQLYPGPMPPLYKAETFFNNGQTKHYQEPASLPSEALATNSNPQTDYNWSGTQQGGQYLSAHSNRDLAASGTQVNQDQSKPTAQIDGNKQYHEPIPSSGLDNILDFVSHDLNSGKNEHSSFGNESPADASLDRYQITHNFPSAGNLLPSSTTSGPIHYEESPLLDLTKENQDNADGLLSTSDSFPQLEPLSSDYATVTANYYTDNNDLNVNQEETTRLTDSYFSGPDIQPAHVNLGLTSFSNFSNIGHNSGPLLSGLGQLHTEEPNNNSPEFGAKLPKNESADSRNPRRGNQYFDEPVDNLQKEPNGVTRNKQVQVIIPYTSQYTPIPFQPSFNDWHINYDIGRNQGRKVPTLDEGNRDNYVGQESRVSISRVNGSIDVHRLQKNIDNWTIQEYSKATTASTEVPSSSHPYLSPSKKIPQEYLTTTESVDEEEKRAGSNEVVKVYSLGGFSFNDVEHEGSSSNQVTESTEKDVEDENINSSSTGDDSSLLEKEEGLSSNFSASGEQVYVVTPVPARAATTTAVPELAKGHTKQDSKGDSSKKAAPIDSKKTRTNNLDKFEAIERAYQVLPQAVNNLAVASTGKESIPLWGIMEHEEFAALHSSDEEHVDKDVVDAPVLYSGHSKVSHAHKR